MTSPCFSNILVGVPFSYRGIKTKAINDYAYKRFANMNMSVERALGKIGVSHVDELRMMGAKACFMKLKNMVGITQVLSYSLA